VRLPLAILCALVAVAAAVAGCGFGSGEQQDGAVTLTVTRDFGAELLRDPKTGGARDGDTVMRLLQRDFDVETRYGGGFVQEIDGVAGGREGGRRVDWFYYVNGIEAGVGSASRRVSPGDRIWWDHHDWSAAMRIPAVVGSFPEPFTSGSGGRRLPVRLVCAGKPDPPARACDEVETRLENAGLKSAARSTLLASGGKDVLRVIVGRWSDVRGDIVTRQLESGPAASGVYARFDPTGRRLELLDPAGRRVRSIEAGAGLVAATRRGEEQPTWVVTGTDDVGVASAAAALEEDELRDHFALAVDGGRGVPLPIGPAEAPE
jgi:hypothetical protein